MSSETTHEPTTSANAARGYREESSGWAGWIIFASVMMVLAGGLNAIHGLVAIFNDDWVVWGNRANLYLDLTTWGWLHLIVGIVVFLAGIGLLSGNVLARAIAVIVASVAIIANFLFIPAFPVWALTVITVNVFVIYALTAHGRELRRV